MLTDQLTATPDDVRGAEWLGLGTDEEIVWVGKPSKYTMIPLIACGPAIMLGALLQWYLLEFPMNLDRLALLLVPVGLAVSVFWFYRWATTYYVVTTHGLHQRVGIFTGRTHPVEYHNIEEVFVYEQPVVGSAFGFGDVRVYTASASVPAVNFKKIDHPHDVKQEIRDRIPQDTTEGATISQNPAV